MRAHSRLLLTSRLLVTATFLALLPSTPATARGTHPDGLVLVAANDFTAQALWDPTTGAHEPFPFDPGVFAFSPDGAAFAYKGGYDVDSAQVRVRHADGSDVLAGEVAGSDVSQISFSGDGSQLAVWSTQYDPDTVDRITVLSSDGSTAPRVILDDAGDTTLITGAAWNPTSDEIAFIREGVIGLLPSTGGAAHDFASECTWVGTMPDCPAIGLGERWYRFDSVSFSPSGEQVVGEFTGYTDQGADSPRIGVLTRGSRVAVELARVPVADDGSYRLESAGFSPDGTRVAYTSTYDHEEDLTDVYVVPASGGDAALVTRGTDPVWQPCPSGACPRFGAAEPVATTISLNYSTSGTLVRANGQVDPPVGGQRVTVRLQRLTGSSWTTVGQKSPLLSARSRYVVKFPRAKTFLCRLVATYPGDAGHLASSATKKFSC